MKFPTKVFKTLSVTWKNTFESAVSMCCCLKMVVMGLLFLGKV